MSLWRDLILKYHTFHRIPVLIVHECDLWANKDIDRALSLEDIQIVMADFIKSGHGEWEDETTKTRCRILWRKPEQLASDIYEWANGTFLLHFIAVRNRKGKTLLLFGSL